MTRIRATCPRCGEVDLLPADIELHVRRSGTGEVGEGSTYAFDCPECAEEVVKPADERIARLLATGGVTVQVGEDEERFARTAQRPAHPVHPETPPAGPAFTLDDVLALHELLQGEDWFDDLRANVKRS